MADTPNHEYNVPDQGDQDWHQPLNENFEDYDTDIEIRDEESNLGNYDPKDGAKFLATDTEVVYVGDGNNWNQLQTSGPEPSFDQVNPSNNFLGVGRGSRVTTSEFFGVQATVKSGDHGGMYVNGTDPDSVPFYGYGTDGNEKAWHEYDGATDKWHLYNGGNHLTVQSDGNVGIGTEDPSAALAVDGDVGIGTDDPSSTLEVSGTATVTGTFETETITTGGSSPLLVETGSSSVDGIAPAIVMGHPDNAGLTVGGVIAGGGADGDINSVGGECPTVSGGRNNAAVGNYSTVAGGRDNETDAEYATVDGGENNTASADHATVAGGKDNEASGTHSFAAGRQAKAESNGSFVWSSGTDSSLRSLNENEFVAEAAGGFKLFSVSAGATGVELAPGAGSWSSLSTRTAKSNLDPVDGPDVLERVEGLDISTWNYDGQEDDVHHMGPMAEEFYDAFGLGTDEKHISNVDADGVALAAIQGLSEKVDEKDDRIDDLEAENAELRERLAALEERVDAVEEGNGSPGISD